MFDEYAHMNGVNILYILLIEPGYYKFGITKRICDRLNTHKKVLKFVEIVKIFQCSSRVSSFRVEQKFKKYAKSIGILVKKYEQTEIFNTLEVETYVNWIEDAIKLEDNIGQLVIVSPEIKLPRLRLPKYNNIFSISGIRSSAVKIVAAGITAIQKPPVYKPKVIRAKIVKMAEKNSFKCEKCGKEFGLEKHLRQHKSRKTPCIIKAEPVNVEDNLHKCMYCNHSYSSKYTLSRHVKTCKMKNGGIANIPDPNVRLAEQVRILVEEREKEKKEQKKKDEERDKKDEELRAMLRDLIALQARNFAAN
jgi:predicted GIY-YIG superfamily endonuclease